MKNILLVSANPDPDSFTHAVSHAVLSLEKPGEVTVTVLDLYKENFSPVVTLPELRRHFSLDSRIQEQCRLLEQADGIVLLHPDWWGQPPAILKGWLDRVLRRGVAYDYEGDIFEQKQHIGLLESVWVVVGITTCSGSQISTLFDTLWREHVWEFCGVTDCSVQVLCNLRETTYHQRQAWMNSLVQLIRRHL